ncbi:MAG: S-layer homology domain-containing protein [Clostridia bacterium]|nr:S-layer homology domain-containing protein [Clostridia bacterium]
MVEKDITSGISETKFGPNNNVTRAQLARFFYAYTELIGGDIEGAADITAYPDAAKVPAWAKTSIEWAVNKEIIAGVSKGGETLLDPNGNATRAQAARMIMIYTNLTE